MNTGDNLLFLGSHNLAPAQNVRLRPSFQQRVLEKIRLFATAGWPNHFPVVVRALPGMTETVDGVVRYTETALKGVCATTVDGHHRHEGILMLEQIKVGPNTLAAHSEDNDKWLLAAARVPGFRLPLHRLGTHGPAEVVTRHQQYRHVARCQLLHTRKTRKRTSNHSRRPGG